MRWPRVIRSELIHKQTTWHLRSEVNAETSVMQYLSQEDIEASVKTGKTTNKLGISDAGSESEDSGDDSCNVVRPKLSKVLENTDEVMTWLEQTMNTFICRIWRT